MHEKRAELERSSVVAVMSWAGIGECFMDAACGHRSCGLYGCKVGMVPLF